MWDARCEPKVIDAFAKIHGTKELLVSFDGLNIMKAPEKGGSTFSKSWFHTDQSPMNGTYCVQGFINLKESGPEDGGLVIIKGSHRYHARLFQKFGKADYKDNWYKLNEKEIKWLKSKGLEVIKVCAPKGSLVLWDSRTIHCNCPPSKNRKKPRFRYVLYVSYMPRKLATPKDILKKQLAFKNLRMTTHWAHKVKLFGQWPRTYGAQLPKYKLQTELPKLTDVGKKLAGLIPY
jgi:ectoine hydroxylase-related dioxygenase (phytanoyl-CoA dioxygenase family)